MDETIRIKSVTPLARDWGRLDRYEVTHGRGDGGTQTVMREVYDHGSAAAVLMYAPENGCVILTRQFRLPPHLNGDPAWLIEVPAGLLDGEPAEVAARREAMEETGYEPRGLRLVSDIYASPGSLTEKCACFIARYTSGQRLSSGGGLEAEGEDIEVLEIAFDRAFAMIATGEIRDAKTVLLLQALALMLARGEAVGA